MLNINQVLNDKYKIIRIDKSSNDYTIYLAENIKTNIDCLIKQIYSNDIQNYQQTFDILSSIFNENIQKLLDFFILDDCVYIVQEFIDGKYIEDIINQTRNENINIGLLLKWALELTLSIEYLYTLNNGNISCNLGYHNIIIKNNKLMLSNLDITIDDSQSKIQESITFIGKFLKLIYNQVDIDNLPIINTIIEKCELCSYTNYFELIQDLNQAIAKQKEINLISFVVKTFIMILFLILAILIGNFALKTNMIFLMISIIFVFIDIILLLSIDTNLIFYDYKKISKRDKRKFEVIKNITIINTNDVI